MLAWGISDETAVIDGKYTVGRVLGQGGMGVVHEVVHEGLGRRFALKVLRVDVADEEARERFRREARAVGSLKHPNIIEVTDYGIDPHTLLPYLVMELLEGQSLRDRIGREGPSRPLDPLTALEVLDGLAAALDHAHAQGILHRDLKAENVFLREPFTGRRSVTLLDFGLAASLGHGGTATDRLTEEGFAVGTPTYMAPEVALGRDAVKASDIYSVGVIAYEALTGRPPFTGQLEDVLYGHARGAVTVPSELDPRIPPELDGPVLHALAKLPEERPKSARNFVDELRDALARFAERRHREATRAFLSGQIWGRLLVAGLLGVLAALLVPLLSTVGVVAHLDQKGFERQLAWLKPQPLQAPVSIVLIDDASLAQDPTPLGEMATSFAERLEDIFRAGAKGIALDLLLPESWSRSEAFSRLVLRESRRLALGAHAAEDETVMGPECLAGLTATALGEEAERLFGLVDLEPTSDGLVQTLRPARLDRRLRLRPAFAARAASLLGVPPPGDDAQVLLDYRLDLAAIPRISYREVAEVARLHPERFRGRLVLVGADFAGSGERSFRLSGSTSHVPGFIVHAIGVETLYRGRPISSPDLAVVSLIVLAFTSLGSILILVIPRKSLAILTWVVLAGTATSLLVASTLVGRWLWPAGVSTLVATVFMLLAAGLRALLPAFPQVEVFRWSPEPYRPFSSPSP